MELYGRWSPIAKHGYPDYEPDSEQWFKWLEEQQNYILNGYESGGDKISGRLYMKLNFTKILITDRYGNKVPTYPYYVDGLRQLYDEIEDCFKTGDNIIYGKGRDKGFTYDIAQLALYQTQFVDYSTVLALFPGGESPAHDNFLKAYQMAYDAMPYDFTHEAGIFDRKNLLFYGWEEQIPGSKKTTRKGIQSSLTMLKAVNPDVAKSGRYKVVIVEEFGEIKDSLSLITTCDANMREGANKFGIIIAGGTSNALNAGYKDFRELWYHPEDHGFRKLFCPANKQYWGYVNYETGVSDLEGAKEHRMAIRNKFKEGSKELMIEMQNYPFEEKEMFISITRSPFNSLWCAEQTAQIMTNKTMANQIEIGNLYDVVAPNGDKKVEFHLDPNGRFKVLRHPADNLIHPDVGGVDIYRMRSAEWSDSKGAIVGYRPYQGPDIPGNFPTFIYHFRDDLSKETFFKDCALASKYWKMKLLTEKTDEDFFTWFRQHNLAVECLKRKPKLFQNNFNSRMEDYGIAPSKQAQDTALEYAVQDFNNNYQNNVFIELLDELSNFGQENTDIAWAYIWAVLHAYDSIRVLDEFRKKPVKKKRPQRRVENIGGRLVVVNS